jgi:hypothetical protein
MLYAVAFAMGLAAGVICVLIVVFDRWRRLKAQATAQGTKTWQLRSQEQAIAAKESEFNRHTSEKEREFNRQTDEMAAMRRDLEARVISYRELENENVVLKRDLQNIDVNLNKLALDNDCREQEQRGLNQRVAELGSRYLKESVKWISSSLTSNNFTACKQRLGDVVERCRGIGFNVPADEEARLLSDLKANFEMEVRAEIERAEQARIKAQIREEEKLAREIDRELRQLERERAAIQAALEKALADAKGEHNEEVQRLMARLAEAEEKSKRAMSQAQMTKSGHIYVISNIGSFGSDVFKIGMTRRLEPRDRVSELSGAAVPFPFDVHMMVSSNNAPGLENALHRALHRLKINKANPRKEFFKTDIETIRKIVQEHHGEVQYVADAEALEYRQSVAMTDQDAEYIQRIYDKAEQEEEIVADDV